MNFIHVHRTLLLNQPIRAKYVLNLNDIYVLNSAHGLCRTNYFLIYNLKMFYRPNAARTEMLQHCIVSTQIDCSLFIWIILNKSYKHFHFRFHLFSFAQSTCCTECRRLCLPHDSWLMTFRLRKYFPLLRRILC